MDFSRHDMLTPENILQDVLINVGDKEGKKLFHGWYLSQIQECLQELSFDTLFFERRIDIQVDKESLNMDLPAGTFNVKEVYGYNGAICEPGTMTKLWHKRNYYTQGGRVVAKNRGDKSPDPFYVNGRTYDRTQPYIDQLVNGQENPVSNLHYYNVENGVIMISSSARKFDMLHVRLSGVSANLGDTPFIPSIFKQAVVDYVCEAASRALMATEPQMYTALWRVYSSRLDKEGFNGSWHRVSTRISKMSDGEKNDFREYIGRWDY
jgi:hypothetical protein